MNNKDDIEYFNKLIKKAIKKDEHAFSTLIHYLEPEMYKIAKIKLKKEDDIYEAMQETIILIYKHLRKLKNIEFFRTWSMRILINECNKVYKKAEINMQRYTDYDENIKLEYESFNNIESELNMEKMLNCLNETEKIAMTLYYSDNFTTKEISNILGDSEGTIKSRISRAKTKIKNHIEEEKLYEL